MAKTAKIGSMNEQPPIGMNPDGSLRILEPGEPIPPIKIIAPDGTVSYSDDPEDDDISDLDDEDDDTGEDVVIEDDED